MLFFSTLFSHFVLFFATGDDFEPMAFKKHKEQKFVFITNIEQTQDIVVVTADGGRLSWKIENEGFNIQKNLGYELEHKYSRVSFVALKNYYQILQIAHIINQLVEKCCEIAELISQHSKQTVTALWKDLIAFMKTVPLLPGQLQTFLSG